MREETSIPARLAQLQRRIDKLNRPYRAYSHMAHIPSNLIVQLASEQENKSTRSPIHGQFVSVKGNIPVADLPWTEGSAMFAGRIARDDAFVVRLLREAGGIVLGATTLSELAMYAVENAFEPMGLNPWDIRRTAGGSSTGAGVAAALGLADINLGTDSGGSIRNPACHCGVIGFMPSKGSVNMDGIPDHTPSLTNIGIIARSVERVRVAYEVLTRPTDASAIRGRLLVPSRLINEMCDEASLTLFRSATRRMRAAGFELIECEIQGWMQGERAAGVVSMFEAGQALARMDLSNASSALKERVRRAHAVTPHTLQAARRAISDFKSTLGEMLEWADADAVVTPTWPFPAPLIHAQTVEIRGRDTPVDPHRNCFVRAANAAGGCAITLPSGLYAAERVPAGIQIMSAGGRDTALLTIAAKLEIILNPLPPVPRNPALVSSNLTDPTLA